MMTSVAAATAEDFYEERLRAGQAAFRAKQDPQGTIDDLRIAAFGLLERPPRLSEALVWLALAQTHAGRGADADATIARFLEVERRFAPYAQLKLDPDIRADFQALLLRRVSASSLLLLPGLAGIVETEEQKMAKLSPSERVKALESAAKREPTNPRWTLGLAREAATKPDPKATVQWATRTLELEPGNAEARTLRAHAYTARGEWSQALADLQTLGPAQVDARPALLADRFVCLVETKDWPQAAEAWRKVPTDQKNRPDVAKASKRLAAERPGS